MADRSEGREKREEETRSERLDKWLWVARFFKTRSLAADAVDRGKIEVNGERAKRAKSVAAGDAVSVRNGPIVTTVRVLGIAPRRGDATAARVLYEETAESVRARELTKIQLASLPVRHAGEGKPSKRDRREIRKLRGDSDKGR